MHPIRVNNKFIVSLPVICASLLLIAAGCSKYETSLSRPDEADEKTPPEAVQLIPLEDALETLGEFMAGVNPDAPLTKSGLTKEVASIEIHYGDGAFTKSRDPVPDAYVVNFADDGGFAVLGANTDVAPIVALTENGTILGETLSLKGLKEVGKSKEFLEDVIAEGTGGGWSANGSASQKKYTENSLLANPLWSQGSWHKADMFNKYCLDSKGYHVLAGCSTVAMAEIMAYNACPSDLTIDGLKMEWTPIAYLPPEELDPLGQEEVGKLVGFVFNNVDRFISSEGTAISAASVKKFMTNVAQGYQNVRMYSDNCFSNEMIQATSDMLRDDKPVFISAFTGSLFEGHSWVIDGALYAKSGKYTGTYMVHCNWGWGGMYNGYYSVNCFMPSDPGADLDYEADEEREGRENEKEFKRSFRVLTYDLNYD